MIIQIEKIPSNLFERNIRLHADFPAIAFVGESPISYRERLVAKVYLDSNQVNEVLASRKKESRDEEEKIQTLLEGQGWL